MPSVRAKTAVAWNLRPVLVLLTFAGVSRFCSTRVYSQPPTVRHRNEECMKKFGAAVILLSSALAGQEPQSLVTNLQYRLTWGDLGEIVPAPFKSFRGLRISSGGEGLL